MDLNGLWLNLLSEAIGIGITVFVVDRLLVHHARKPWEGVRAFFWQRVQEECCRINVAFSLWLCQLSTQYLPQVLAFAGEPRASSLKGIQSVPQIVTNSSSIQGYLGNPVGSDFAIFALRAEKQQIEQFRRRGKPNKWPFLSPNTAKFELNKCSREQTRLMPSRIN